MSNQLSETARRYLRFAEHEALGVSPTYHEFALAVASSPECLRLLDLLAPSKRQPNLLFAAVKHLFGVARNGSEFISIVEGEFQALADTMQSRRVQTNEPGRCSILLPLLSQIAGPFALIELGASAGLCLLPDKYRYIYEQPDGTVTEVGDVGPELHCRVFNDTPFDSLSLPQISWRRGVDINPLDASNPNDRSWLESLVWPEQVDRLHRLRLCLDEAAEDPPEVIAGDVEQDLDELLSSAPQELPLVVMHSAVFSYFSSREVIAHHAQLLKEHRCDWISNEGSRVLPDVTSLIPHEVPAGDFVVAMNGIPYGLAGAHGQSLNLLK